MHSHALLSATASDVVVLASEAEFTARRAESAGAAMRLTPVATHTRQELWTTSGLRDAVQRLKPGLLDTPGDVFVDINHNKTTVFPAGTTWTEVCVVFVCSFFLEMTLDAQAHNYNGRAFTIMCFVEHINSSTFIAVLRVENEMKIYKSPKPPLLEKSTFVSHLDAQQQAALWPEIITFLAEHGQRAVTMAQVSVHPCRRGGHRGAANVGPKFRPCSFEFF